MTSLVSFGLPVGAATWPPQPVSHNSTSQIFGAAIPPMTYNAITDTVYRPRPAVPPPLGPAGYTFTDSTFGSRYLRVTDGNTSVGTSNDYKDTSYVTTSASYKNEFNVDSSKFFVTGYSGIIPYSFDPASMTATCYKNIAGSRSVARYGCASLPLSTEPEFSYIDPNIIYGTVNLATSTIAYYDFAANAVTTLFDVSGTVGVYSHNSPARLYANDIVISSDDQTIAVNYGTGQGYYQWTVVYDRLHNSHHVLDTINSTLDGTPLPFTLGFGTHDIDISRDGNYILLEQGVVYATSSLPSTGPIIWNLSDNQFYAFPNNANHRVAGFGLLINNDQLTAQAGPQFLIRGLDQASVNNSQQLLPAVPNSCNYFLQDSHPSWNNARLGILPPFFASFDDDVPVPFYNPNPQAYVYDGEIVGVETDGAAQTVWRFGYNWSDASRGSSVDFYASSRGNISPDGRFFIFTSNWLNTLGTNPLILNSTNERKDVFILDLQSAHAPGANQPVISAFAASPVSVASGSPTTLSWNVTNADTVSIAPGAFSSSALSGSITVSPATTTTYTLTATKGSATTTVQTVLIVTPGNQPVTIPTGLAASSTSSSQINLSWNPSTAAAGLAGYKIFRDNVFIANTTDTTYSNTGLSAGSIYGYRVAAFDTTGSSSPPSAVTFASTKPGVWLLSCGDWSKRMSITIDHTKVSPANHTSLASFPVLIKVTDPDLRSMDNGGLVASSTGADILFTASDGLTKLNHEIESYASSTGSLSAWVNVPTLATTTDTTLYLYYGNTYSADQSNKTGVWDSDFKIVNHFKEITGGLSDSTGNNNAATASGNASSTLLGLAGNAYSFDGNSGLATINNSSSWAATTSVFSLELALKPNSPAVNYRGFLRFGNWGASATYSYQMASGTLLSSLTQTPGSQNWPTASCRGLPLSFQLAPDGQYHQVAMTYSGLFPYNGLFAVYVDGALYCSSPYATGATAFGTGNICLGGACDQLRAKVDIDEFRLSSGIARSADWIKTEYNNEFIPGFFSLSQPQTPN